MGLSGRVIEILQQRKGTAVSGEELAQALGVTRNSVWKAVNKLKKDGYQIEAATNKGYVLLSEGDVLTASSVSRHLGAYAKVLKIDVRQSVSSTNTVLKELAEQGGKEGSVLLSESQTDGKGRLGRSFFSPARTGLYMSILLRPRFPAEESLLITTAAAVATAKGIEETTGIPAEIKWVNDVYVRKRKVCGILTEASVDFENGKLNYAVLGIGVNIKEPEGGFSPELARVATALYQAEPPEGIRAKLAAGILRNFMEYYQTLEKKRFMQEYKKRSLLTGLNITFTRGNISEKGTVLGIDDDARLLVRLENGDKRCYSAGEVNIAKGFLD